MKWIMHAVSPLRAGALGLALLVLGCGEEPQTPAAVIRPIKMLEIGAQKAGSKLEYPGEISATQHAEVAFEVAGRIIELPVDEAQDVEQGALLARLDPRDFQARLDSEQARLKHAEAEHARSKALFKADVIAKAELDRKQRSFGVAEADARQARKALEDTYLRAPFSGVVAKKLVKDFQHVKAKQPVLILQDTTSLEIVIHLPERDVAAGERGLTLEERSARLMPLVAISSLPGRLFPARIQEFSTTADPVTRTFKATLAFATPPDVLILPGMTARIILTRRGGSGQGFRLPASAVLTDETGEAFVWRVEPDSMQVRRTPVTLGDLSGATVEIRSGLSSGALIAISGVHHLREGMQVRRLDG